MSAHSNHRTLQSASADSVNSFSRIFIPFIIFLRLSLALAYTGCSQSLCSVTWPQFLKLALIMKSGVKGSDLVLGFVFSVEPVTVSLSGVHYFSSEKVMTFTRPSSFKKLRIVAV